MNPPVMEKIRAHTAEQAQAAQKERAERFNLDKPQLHYLLTAPLAVQGVAQVMQHGAEKYTPHNWKKGMPYSEIVDSLLRHLAQFLNGEDRDAASGLHHVDHIACNALFLAELSRTKSEFDDREHVAHRDHNGKHDASH